LKVLWDTFMGSLNEYLRKWFFKEPCFERFFEEPEMVLLCHHSEEPFLVPDDTFIFLCLVHTHTHRLVVIIILGEYNSESSQPRGQNLRVRRCPRSLSLSTAQGGGGARGSPRCTLSGSSVSGAAVRVGLEFTSTCEERGESIQRFTQRPLHRASELIRWDSPHRPVNYPCCRRPSAASKHTLVDGWFRG